MRVPGRHPDQSPERRIPPSTKRTPRAGQEGSTLVLTLLILASLSIIASTMVVTAMGDRNLSKYDRHSLLALGAAETGVAYAKRAIVSITAPLEDYDGDGRPDFTMSDSLSWGGGYTVVAEASDIKGLGITAYQANGYAIVSEGSFLGAHRRVKVEIVHDSFLKFARFVAVNNLSYACNALLTGDVYTGGDLNIPCGCSAGQNATFLEGVYAVDDIPNAGCGDFHRGYVTDADEIDLENAFDWSDTRDKAQGVGAENDCEGRGEVGIYLNLGGTDPLGLGGQAAPFTNVLDFSRFDFMNETVVAGDTVITYNGAAVINPVTGSELRTDEFNGIIFFDGNAEVRGRVDGVSGRNLTVFATSDVYVKHNVVTGHNGFDEITRLPNGSGDPVNVGLVAEDQVIIATGTPRVLQVDAALFSRTNNWSASGGTSTGDHPVATGPLDLDLDGIIGETPFNNDPVPGAGWNENSITSATWVLNITGPIITKYGGSAGPWVNSGVLAGASGNTRRYNYDLDITEYPPPCFPVPLNLWKDVSWTEIFDVRDELASHLPN